MSSSTGSREVFETSRARARRVAGSTILRSRPSSVEGTSTDQSPSLYHASTVRRPHSEPSKQQQQQRSLTQTDSARNKSGGGGAVKEGAPPRPRRKKKPILYQPRKSVRPSLSEQLAAIGSSAETINKSICSKFGLAAPAAPLLRTPAKTFVVGKLTAKIPGPVAFFKDRCTYSFFHPFQSKEIQMVMYYRDMRDVQVSKVSQTLSFRLGKRMEQFGSDYEPSNHAHRVVIGFSSDHDISQLNATVMKFVSGRR